MPYYILRNAREYGPYDIAALKQYVHDGKILKHDQAKDAATGNINTAGYFLKASGIKCRVKSKGSFIAQLRSTGAAFIIYFFAVALSSWTNNPLNFYAGKAQEALSDSKYDDALEYALKEIEENKDNPDGYYQAALSLQALMRPGESLSMFNKAIALAKKNKRNKDLAVMCLVAKSGLLLEIGDSVEALRALDDGLKIDKKNIDMLVARGWLLRNSDSKAALKDFQKAKKLNAGDPRPYLGSAFILNNENNLEQALADISKVIEIDSKMSVAYGLRGSILKQLGRSPDWIDDYLTCFDLNTDSDDRSDFLAGTEDAESRILIIEELKRRRTHSNGYYQLLADLLYGWNEYEQAEEAFLEIINLGLADAYTYSDLAECQDSQGRFLKAFYTASTGLDLFPDDFLLKFMKARIGIKTGKGAEVLPIMDSLISDFPEVYSFYAEKGKAYMSLGRYADAVEPFETAVILHPSPLNKLYHGDALRMSGNMDKAVAEYNDILEMSPSGISGEGSIPGYMYAMAYSGLGDRDKALAAVKVLAADMPDAGLDVMPLIYSRLGSTQEALDALKIYAGETEDWNPLIDLYSYDFHILHANPDFVALLADKGLTTSYNKATGLLEYAPDLELSSFGGTPWQEAIDSLHNNPSDWVKSLNQMCPIDMGVGAQITSVEFDEGSPAIVYNCIVNPVLFNIKFTNENPSYKKKKEDVITLGFISNYPQIADSGVAIKYYLKAADDSGMTTLFISTERINELKIKKQSQDEIDKLMLSFWAEEEELVFRENPDMSGASVIFDGKTFNYIYNADEDGGALAYIELFNSELKKQLSKVLDDPLMKSRIPIFVRQRVTVKFSYKGDVTGKIVEIVFTPDELAQHLN